LAAEIAGYDVDPRGIAVVAVIVVLVVVAAWFSSRKDH
jgi:hypothetical protein